MFLSLAASDGVELGKIIHKVPVSHNPKCEGHIAYSVNFVIFYTAEVTERHLSLILQRLLELNWAKSTKFPSLVTQSARVILLALSILSYFAQPW